MQSIKITNFEGPLDLLLQLIEKREVEISNVSISEVTNQYLQAVEEMKANKDIANLASYLEVASELVYLKSKTILPGTEEEKEETADLEERLREYQKYSNATKYFEDVVAKEMRSFTPVSRPKFEIHSTFTPPKDLDMDKILDLFKQALAKVPEAEAMEEESIKIDKINVEQKYAEIKALIFAQKKISFTELLATSKTKIEVVVTFLAILEMIKQGSISVMQNDIFKDIYITTNEHGNNS